MVPREDNDGVYEKIQKIITDNQLRELEYLAVSGNPLGFPLEEDQAIVKTVIAPSGYITDKSGITPTPSGLIDMIRLGRDDHEGKELNIDDRYYWSDVNGKAWYVCVNPGDIHGQPYIDGSGLGNLESYDGIPTSQRGLVNELKSVDFTKALLPYGKTE